MYFPNTTDEFALNACPSFINDEALSSELAGYFFLTIDENDKALQYFLHAHEKYHDWGAVAKCNALFEFVQTAFNSSCSAVDSFTSNNVHGASEDRNLSKSIKGYELVVHHNS